MHSCACRVQDMSPACHICSLGMCSVAFCSVVFCSAPANRGFVTSVAATMALLVQCCASVCASFCDACNQCQQCLVAVHQLARGLCFSRGVLFCGRRNPIVKGEFTCMQWAKAGAGAERLLCVLALCGCSVIALCSGVRADCVSSCKMHGVLALFSFCVGLLCVTAL